MDRDSKVPGAFSSSLRAGLDKVTADRARRQAQQQQPPPPPPPPAYNPHGPDRSAPDVCIDSYTSDERLEAMRRAVQDAKAPVTRQQVLPVVIGGPGAIGGSFSNAAAPGVPTVPLYGIPPSSAPAVQRMSSVGPSVQVPSAPSHPLVAAAAVRTASPIRSRLMPSSGSFNPAEAAAPLAAPGRSFRGPIAAPLLAAPPPPPPPPPPAMPVATAPVPTAPAPAAAFPLGPSSSSFPMSEARMSNLRAAPPMQASLRPSASSFDPASVAIPVQPPLAPHAGSFDPAAALRGRPMDGMPGAERSGAPPQPMPLQPQPQPRRGSLPKSVSLQPPLLGPLSARVPLQERSVSRPPAEMPLAFGASARARSRSNAPARPAPPGGPSPAPAPMPVSPHQAQVAAPQLAPPPAPVQPPLLMAPGGGSVSAALTAQSYAQALRRSRAVSPIRARMAAATAAPAADVVSPILETRGSAALDAAVPTLLMTSRPSAAVPQPQPPTPQVHLQQPPQQPSQWSTQQPPSQPSVRVFVGSVGGGTPAGSVTAAHGSASVAAAATPAAPVPGMPVSAFASPSATLAMPASVEMRAASPLVSRRSLRERTPINGRRSVSPGAAYRHVRQMDTTNPFAATAALAAHVAANDMAADLRHITETSALSPAVSSSALPGTSHRRQRSPDSARKSVNDAVSIMNSLADAARASEARLRSLTQSRSGGNITPAMVPEAARDRLSAWRIQEVAVTSSRSPPASLHDGILDASQPLHLQEEYGGSTSSSDPRREQQDNGLRPLHRALAMAAGVDNSRANLLAEITKTRASIDKLKDSKVSVMPWDDSDSQCAPFVARMATSPEPAIPSWQPQHFVQVQQQPQPQSPLATQFVPASPLAAPRLAHPQLQSPVAMRQPANDASYARSPFQKSCDDIIAELKESGDGSTVSTTGFVADEPASPGDVMNSLRAEVDRVHRELDLEREKLEQWQAAMANKIRAASFTPEAVLKKDRRPSRGSPEDGKAANESSSLLKTADLITMRYADLASPTKADVKDMSASNPLSPEALSRAAARIALRLQDKAKLPDEEGSLARSQLPLRDPPPNASVLAQVADRLATRLADRAGHGAVRRRSGSDIQGAADAESQDWVSGLSSVGGAEDDGLHVEVASVSLLSRDGSSRAAEVPFAAGVADDSREAGQLVRLSNGHRLPGGSKEAPVARDAVATAAAGSPSGLYVIGPGGLMDPATRYDNDGDALTIGRISLYNT
eukprot:TRINITY_DN3855_c0_g2_i2.p1 TRINITY_DN3855_c0_g2~~TRINITY_DN3855_c0_g2_i2.p1  ORF type:complete len:1241 (+),score=229.80 TRINITY_DN3855_c0_g2_i2:74-3796(+)